MSKGEQGCYRCGGRHDGQKCWHKKTKCHGCAKVGHLRHIDMQEVKDVSGGCGSSFEVLVVSSQFEGKPLLQRQVKAGHTAA